MDFVGGLLRITSSIVNGELIRKRKGVNPFLIFVLVLRRIEQGAVGKIAKNTNRVGAAFDQNGIAILQRGFFVQAFLFGDFIIRIVGGNAGGVLQRPIDAILGLLVAAIQRTRCGELALANINAEGVDCIEVIGVNGKRAGHVRFLLVTIDVIYTQPIKEGLTRRKFFYFILLILISVKLKHGLIKSTHAHFLRMGIFK